MINLEEVFTEHFGKIVVLVILIILGFIGMIPYFEAKNFNKCTGGNATYSTAFFTQLRVENCK